MQEKDYSEYTLTEAQKYQLRRRGNQAVLLDYFSNSASFDSERRTLHIQVDDAKEDGDQIRVVTKTGSLVVSARFSWQTSPGYVVVPHHYGFISQGKQYGETVNKLVGCQELDELTGNPLFRHINCRIERVEK